MAARASRLIVCTVALLLAAAPVSRGQPSKAGSQPPTRIVSLVPAVTEMLFAIGAGRSIVGVSCYDTFPPEVQKLPRVGALLDPDTERILALRPDLVVVYASQTDSIARFGSAGIRTFTDRHGGVAAVLETIRKLGDATGHSAEAERLARDIASRIDAVRARVKGRTRPRTLLVLGRQPSTLRNMYVSGGAGFMHEMLDAAGGANVFADTASESVQPSHEVLLMRAPDVILEIRAAGLMDPAAREERQSWASLGSIPAVRSGRIQVLVGDYLVLPGPRIAQAVETFARALHPEAFR
jgi:iron complex transport system substrate-binding protein